MLSSRVFSDGSNASCQYAGCAGTVNRRFQEQESTSNREVRGDGKIIGGWGIFWGMPRDNLNCTREIVAYPQDQCAQPQNLPDSGGSLRDF